MTTSSETKTDIPSENDIVEFDAITAQLLQEYVRLDLGKGYYKMVTYTDFLQTLLTLIGDEENSTKKEEYYLPQGVFFMSVSMTEMKLSMYYPETVREVNYRDKVRLSVVPNIIISHTLLKQSTDWTVRDTRYMSTAKKLQELNRQHYMPTHAGISLLPFTNVYQDGKLCYGANQRISTFKAPDFRGLQWYYEMLFTSPFNDDLGIYAMDKEEFRSDFKKWYEHLEKLAKDGKPFPYNYLRGQSS